MIFKKYGIFAYIICMICIIILVICLCITYGDSRYRQICEVVTKFCQALVDRDYDRASDLLKRGPKGKDWDIVCIKESVEDFIAMANKSDRCPKFKELKHFTVEDVSRVPKSYSSDYIEKWNRYEAIVIFYIEENCQDVLPQYMILRLDKVKQEFKIIAFFHLMNCSLPIDHK